MRKIFFTILCCVMTLCLVSCDENLTPEQIVQKQKHEQRWHGFKVIVVDSCEYLVKAEEKGAGQYATRAGYMAHKGNCRFCAERRKNEMN